MEYKITNAILDNQSIAERIELIQKKRGMTQEELAKVLQISQPAISKYLKNRIPPPGVLLNLARLGQTTIEWILTGEKSYFYYAHEKGISEPDAKKYDAERSMAQSIAGLPAPVREAITTLIEYYD